ncbi:MAG: DUF4338 domain-containing protein [Desulfosarcina sp.]|nr:DUF4338 domain-containing protein [Desulfobacterales bacterium]
MAHTVCELLEWKRPNDRLKDRECSDFLELLEAQKRQYGLEPLLVETLVDRQQFHGGCYRASNWIELGETTGRGRMDKANKLNGAHVKTILVYPLVKNAVRRLREGNK